jgi:hypothetical protein
MRQNQRNESIIDFLFKICFLTRDSFLFYQVVQHEFDRIGKP